LFGIIIGLPACWLASLPTMGNNNSSKSSIIHSFLAAVVATVIFGLDDLLELAGEEGKSSLN